MSRIGSPFAGVDAEEEDDIVLGLGTVISFIKPAKEGNPVAIALPLLRWSTLLVPNSWRASCRR
ncbi:MAG: hypothetical protein R3A10_19635 [Caldilineaceae bacterium]